MNIIRANAPSLVFGTIKGAVIGAVVGAIYSRAKVKEIALLFATVAFGYRILSRSVNQLMGVEAGEFTNKVVAADIALRTLHIAILIIALRKLGVISTKGTLVLGALAGFGNCGIFFRESLARQMDDLGYSGLCKALREKINPSISWTNSIKT
jgi:hypothetical protein